MKIKRILSSAAAVIITLGMCVQAGAYECRSEYTYDGKNVKISGTTQTNSRVLLMVTNGTTTGSICYINQQTGVNGEYSFDYAFPAGTAVDEYTFTVSEMYADSMTQSQKSFNIYKIDDKYSYGLTGFEISGSIEEGEVTGIATIVNPTEKAIDSPVVITAVYEKGTNHVVGVATSTVTSVEAGQTAQIPAKVSFTTLEPDKYYVKAFLWESKATMRPLAEQIKK